MDDAEHDYGTTDLFEMAAIDEQNLEVEHLMINEDIGKYPYKVSVEPVRAETREPYLINYRREVERMNTRLLRTFLAHNPNATAAELIDRIDPDKKES
jgi:hypothetical protein